MAESYKLGTKVWFEGTFTSKDTGQATDPDEVTVKAWYDGDTVDEVQTFTYTGGGVERTATGVYRVGIVSAKARRLYTQFAGSGVVDVVQSEYAIIEDTGVPA